MPTQTSPELQEIAQTTVLANPNLGVVERNQILDTLLNPEGALPVVQLRPIPMATTHYDRGFAIYNDQDKAIGTVHYRLPDEFEGESFAMMRSVGIADDYTGKGNGKATYLEVLKSLPEGVGLKSSDASLTKGSLLLWQWLEDSGVVSSNDPERIATPDDQGHYTGLNYKTLFAKPPTHPEQVPTVREQQIDEPSFLARAARRILRRT